MAQIDNQMDSVGNDLIQQRKTHVRFFDLVHIAASNLKFHKLRSALTIIGISIGAGSSFLLVSFGLGIQNLVTEQITQGQAVNSMDIGTSGSQLLKATDQTVSDIRALPSVSQASGYYMNIGKLTIKGASTDIVVYGVDKLYLQAGNVNVSVGKMLDTEQSDQIMLSSSILDAIGDQDYKSGLGTKVSLNIKLDSGEILKKQFEVAGVVSSESGNEAFVSSGVFKDAGVEDYAGIMALANNREDVTTARGIIEGRGYSVSSPVDTLNQVDQFFKVLRVVLVSFGSIGMIIAILGMINTLTVSLLERTKEVALMNALGARPRDMSRLFMIEAALLSLLGVILGIFGAFLISIGVNVGLNVLASSRGASGGFSVFSMPLWLIFGTTLIMMIIGYIVSIAPSRRAKNLNIIKALRSE